MCEVDRRNVGCFGSHRLTLVPRPMARVLLVEDEPNIASIIVFKLEREGHQVRWEASATALPAAVEATQPELVLLHSSLPDGDPFTLLNVLSQPLPVVMMTWL